MTGSVVEIEKIALISVHRTMEAKREIIQRIREKSSRIPRNYGKSSNGLNRAFFEAQKIRESSVTAEKVPL
jgi:hypothetical protein